MTHNFRGMGHQLSHCTVHGRFRLAIVSRAALVATVALSLGACGDDADPITPPSSYPLTLDVFTPGYVYSPPVADIAKGGTIRFVISESPDGDGHNALFQDAAGAPPDVPIVKDTAVTRTFDTIGSFPYLCTVHPGMVGEVIVH